MCVSRDGRVVVLEAGEEEEGGGDVRKEGRGGRDDKLYLWK